MKKTIEIADIKYQIPEVFLLNQNGIGSAEFAGRTAYDSFNSSENEEIKLLDQYIKEGKSKKKINKLIKKINKVEDSSLLDSLAWVYHHHSVVEHSVLTYLFRGVSRGVLQELARHRIASYTVKSTRYTMGTILNIFVAAMSSQEPRKFFKDTIEKLDMFVTDKEYSELECDSMFNKLLYQRDKDTDAFYNNILSKDAATNIANITDPNLILSTLNSSKKKRNVGDAFKHLVTDNWKTDVVITINLRSLKNFLELRDSGAAYFLIRELAKEIKKETPKKYLGLMAKEFRKSKEN
jgi:thymidylate synthase (FAD)